VSRARVAIYDGPAVAPRVEDVSPGPVGEFIEALSVRVYELAREQGGTIPYTVVREVAENLIHAGFAEPVVSILDGGETVRFADQGPGIPDKLRAQLPGFTTATGDMKRHIRGVGSGLPLVKDYLAVSGGGLTIEDNLGSGAVVTITCRRSSAAGPRPAPSASWSSVSRERGLPAAEGLDLGLAEAEPPCRPRRLSTRQKQVLALVMESGSAGPSVVARELGVGVSTAYRDLASLEDMGLISADGGKRALTGQGMSYLDDLIAGA
jgi:anti-sigma regulatory factor (Ser/Thr protein kinase)